MKRLGKKVSKDHGKLQGSTWVKKVEMKGRAFVLFDHWFVFHKQLHYLIIQNVKFAIATLKFIISLAHFTLL